MNFSQVLSGAAIAVAVGTFAMGAQAVPVTYNFTGTVQNAVSNGTLAGVFSNGDAFTLAAQFNLGPAPDYGVAPGHYTATQWYSGNLQVWAVNGQTYTVGDSVTGYDDRYLEAWAPNAGNNDVMRQIGYDTTASYGGAATSTFGPASYVSGYWLLGSVGLDLLDFNSPDFLPTLNLADWTVQYFQLYLQDYSTNSFAYFFGPAFASVTVGDPVPTPGALMLFGLGLLGLGAARRRRKAG